MNIGLIGVGRLGLAYALCLEEAGFSVVASSYKEDYVNALSRKQTDSTEPGIAEMLQLSKKIAFTTNNNQVIEQCDLVYVLVATPSLPDGSYDVSAVFQVANDYLNYPGNLVDKILVIGSTVNPGTTDAVQKILANRGVHVVYAPTFSAQGEVLKTIKDPHTLSLGTNNQQVADKCKNVFDKLSTDPTPVYVMQPTTAEILKLAGNCKATLNISFANMVGQLLINSGMAQDLEIARDYLSFVKKHVRWQFGFGYGGPCYPRDNRAMISYANSIGLDYQLGALIDNFNETHTDYLTDYFVKNNASELPYYFEYVSYKKGVNIFEESQQLTVCKNLLRQGALVYIEPSKFLLPLIQQELSQEFDTVHFVSAQQLEQQKIAVYKIEI